MAPSLRVLRQRVPVSAMVPPITTAITKAMMLSSSVAGRRFSTKALTGWRSEIDVPKSP